LLVPNQRRFLGTGNNIAEDLKKTFPFRNTDKDGSGQRNFTRIGTMFRSGY